MMELIYLTLFSEGAGVLEGVCFCFSVGASKLRPYVVQAKLRHRKYHTLFCSNCEYVGTREVGSKRETAVLYRPITADTRSS